MKRRRQPDTRLDWRNPDMPVLRKNVNGKDIEVSANYIASYYWQKINDPSLLVEEEIILCTAI